MADAVAVFKEDRMFVRKIVHTLCGVVLLGVLGTSATGAFSNPSRTTYFTFSRTVQMPGVALPAGTYIFEVMNPNGGSDVVRVLSRDRKVDVSHEVDARRVSSVERQSRASITLGETPAGTPPRESVVSAKRDPRPRVHLLTHPHPRRAERYTSCTAGQP